MSRNNNKKSRVFSQPIIITTAVVVLAVILTVSSLFYLYLPRYDEAEVPGAAAQLIEASYEVNTIFFGEGLPTVGFGVEPDEILGEDYAEVSEDSPYKTTAEVKEAALKVYTEDYCEFLFTKAFIGQVVDFEEPDSEDLGQTVQIPARYLAFNGKFMVRKTDESERLKLEYTYDTANVRIVKKYAKKVKIAVPAFADGKPVGEEEFLMILTKDGWRLDDPTY